MAKKPDEQHADDCPNLYVLPYALQCLTHVHLFHGAGTGITSLAGGDKTPTDIYIVSGEARAAMREAVDLIIKSMGADVDELHRLYNLKPKRATKKKGDV